MQACWVCCRLSRREGRTCFVADSISRLEMRQSGPAAGQRTPRQLRGVGAAGPGPHRTAGNERRRKLAIHGSARAGDRAPLSRLDCRATPFAAWAASSAHRAPRSSGHRLGVVHRESHMPDILRVRPGLASLMVALGSRLQRRPQRDHRAIEIGIWRLGDKPERVAMSALDT